VRTAAFLAEETPGLVTSPKYAGRRGTGGPRGKGPPGLARDLYNAELLAVDEVLEGCDHPRNARRSLRVVSSEVAKTDLRLPALASAATWLERAPGRRGEVSEEVDRGRTRPRSSAAKSFLFEDPGGGAGAWRRRCRLGAATARDWPRAHRPGDEGRAGPVGGNGGADGQRPKPGSSGAQTTSFTRVKSAAGRFRLDALEPRFAAWLARASGRPPSSDSKMSSKRSRAHRGDPPRRKQRPRWRSRLSGRVGPRSRRRVGTFGTGVLVLPRAGAPPRPRSGARALLARGRH